MKIAYLVDSSFNIPEQFQKRELNKRITFVPLIVIDNEDNQYDDPKVSIPEDDLVKIMKANPKGNLKTSLTPQGILEKTIKKLLKNHDYVVGLCIDKTLSNQFSQFEKMETQSEFKGKFFYLGKRNIPAKSYLILAEFDHKIKNETTLNKEVRDRIFNEISENQHADTFVFVTNLDRLVAGGRLSKSKAAIAKMGKIKITLKVEEEGLEKFAINRSLLKAVNDVISLKKKEASPDLKNLQVFVMFFGTEEEERKNVLKTVSDEVENIHYSKCNSLPSIMAAHIGVGTSALVVVNIKDTSFLN